MSSCAVDLQVLHGRAAITLDPNAVPYVQCT
jgi:hypothetical protein